MNWLELSTTAFLFLALGSSLADSRWTRLSNCLAPFLVWGSVAAQCVQNNPSLPTLFVVIGLLLFGIFSTLGQANKTPALFLSTGFMAASVLHHDPAWKILFIWFADGAWIGFGEQISRDRAAVFSLAKISIVSLLPATLAALSPVSEATPYLILATILIRCGAGPFFTSPFKNYLKDSDELIFLSGLSGAVLWFSISPQPAFWSLIFLSIAALSVFTLDTTAAFTFFLLAILNSNGSMEFLFCALTALVALRSRAGFFAIPVVIISALYLLANDLTPSIDPSDLAPVVFGLLGALLTRTFLTASIKTQDKKLEIVQMVFVVTTIGLGIYFQNLNKWESWTDGGITVVVAALLFSILWFWLAGAKPKTTKSIQFKKVWPVSFAFLKKSFYRWSFEWAGKPQYNLDTRIARFSERCAIAMRAEPFILLFSLGFSVAVGWWVVR